MIKTISIAAMIGAITSTIVHTDSEISPKTIPLKDSGIDPEYIKAVDHFVDLYATQQAVSFAASGDPNYQDLAIVRQGGRKYDKVVMILTFKDLEAVMNVKFFIHRKTGAIFGAKSELAPNEKRYWGTIYNVDKWDWSGESPTNVNDETVVAGDRKYGNVTFYSPKKSKKA